jgi:CheY-like chemotaxis protein
MKQPDSNEEMLQGRRILVVDDCTQTAKVIEAELSGKGLEVLLASSADEATIIIAKPETRPDLVLLDVNMPGVNGPQLCRFIKSNKQFCDLKVILCSERDQLKLALTAESCGADGYVHKQSILGRWVLNQLKPDGLSD